MIGLFHFVVMLIIIKKTSSTVYHHTTSSFLARKQYNIPGQDKGLDDAYSGESNPIHYKPGDRPMNENEETGYVKSSGVEKKVKKTARPRPSVKYECDHNIVNCLRAYVTGPLCARTVFYEYLSFPNYCRMDYANCMLEFEMWQVLHMGECYEYVKLPNYSHEEMSEDTFMEKDYVIENT